MVVCENELLLNQKKGVVGIDKILKDKDYLRIDRDNWGNSIIVKRDDIGISQVMVFSRTKLLEHYFLIKGELFSASQEIMEGHMPILDLTDYAPFFVPEEDPNRVAVGVLSIDQETYKEKFKNLEGQICNYLEKRRDIFS